MCFSIIPEEWKILLDLHNGGMLFERTRVVEPILDERQAVRAVKLVDEALLVLVHQEEVERKDPTRHT